MVPVAAGTTASSGCWHHWGHAPTLAVSCTADGQKQLWTVGDPILRPDLQSWRLVMNDNVPRSGPGPGPGSNGAAPSAPELTTEFEVRVGSKGGHFSYT